MKTKINNLFGSPTDEVVSEGGSEGGNQANEGEDFEIQYAFGDLKQENNLNFPQ